MRAKSGAPLAFAGLWETWTGPNGEELDTAAIVTTRANRTLAPIHERMPVIVPPEAFDLWLDCAEVDADTAAALIAPAPDGLLEAYEISTAVNRTANDNPKLLEPVVPPQAARAGQARARTRAAQTRQEGRRAGVVVLSGHSTLPGLRMPLGSSMRLRPRISSSATGSLYSGRMSRFITPTPCSAEIEPP